MPVGPVARIGLINLFGWVRLPGRLLMGFMPNG